MALLIFFSFFLFNLVGHFSVEKASSVHSLAWYYNISSSSSSEKGAQKQKRTDSGTHNSHTDSLDRTRCRVVGGREEA